AQIVRDADEWTHGEIAFAVADAYHGRGIGSALVDRLAADARAAGITHLTATIQSSNRAALVLVRRVARPVDVRFEGGEASLVAALSAAADPQAALASPPPTPTVQSGSPRRSSRRSEAATRARCPRAAHP